MTNLNEIRKTPKAVNSFSSSPVFRQNLKNYADQTGLSFSEVVRHLCMVGMRVENRESLITLNAIRTEVEKQYRQDNLKHYRESNVVVPDNRYMVSAKTGAKGSTVSSPPKSAEEMERERFERIYNG